MLKLLKFLTILIPLAILVALFQLPDPLGKDTPLHQFESLPDADIRAMAEREWQEGRRGTAVSLLDYIIENNLPDAPGARSLKENYLAVMQRDATPLGRIKSFGYGALTGNVDSFESLAGSAVADLIVYGDIRDIVRELCFEDQADTFVVLLSGVGVATTLFPEAEPAITLLKVSKRTGSLTEPMIKHISEALTYIKSAPQPAVIAKAQDIFVPVFQLAKRCRNWTEFETLLKCAKHPEQLKVLTKMVSTAPQNTRKLTQILSVVWQESRENAGKTIDFLMAHGQKGMDSLYGGLRKGPKGIQFLIDHPTFFARSAKNVKKTGNLGWNHVQDWWGAFSIKNRLLATLTKFGLAGVLLAIIVWRILRIIPMEHLRLRGHSGLKTAPRNGRAALIGIGAGGLFSLIMFLASRQEGGIPLNGPTSPGGEPHMVGFHGIGMDGFSMALMFSIIVAAQLGCYALAFSKIKHLSGDASSDVSMKLKRLENLDIFFDLPLYCGLAVTIFSFILISSFGAGIARFLAYSSTLVGIIVAVIIRVYLLYPFRERLIKEAGE